MSGRCTLTAFQNTRLEQAWASGLRSTGNKSLPQISLLAKEIGISAQKVKVSYRTYLTQSVNKKLNHNYAFNLMLILSELHRQPQQESSRLYCAKTT